MSRRTFLAELDDLRAWRKQPTRDPAAVREWAEPLLRRAYAAAPRGPVTGPEDGPIPLAGSRRWAALDDRDPRKPAAVVLAALASLEESTPAAIATQVAADWARVQRDVRERLAASVADKSDNLGHVIGHLPFCLTARRTLTSNLRCGHPGCTTVVRFVHPLPQQLADALPDTSSVRCTRHDRAAAESAGRIQRAAA